MKTRNQYIRPEMEIIEVELEGTMAQSSGGSSFDLGDGGEVDGGANAKRRSFWED